MAVTNLVGQVGCVTGFVAVVIIGIAFGAGWFLDDLLGNDKRWLTIAFMIGSFPVTLYAMVRISLGMLNRTNENIDKLNQQDKDKSST